MTIPNDLLDALMKDYITLIPMQFSLPVNAFCFKRLSPSCQFPQIPTQSNIRRRISSIVSFAVKLVSMSYQLKVITINLNLA
jgi:hypothetical protein